MKVTEEKKDDLNAVVSIKLSTEDYKDSVEKLLKQYRKTAKMSGFRPGMVPMGMVKKMYGKSAIAEEVNKILQEQLNKHIQENELDILGQPLPQEGSDVVFDANTYPEIEFTYEIGLAPDFSVNISDKDKFNYSTIKVDEELIEKYTNDLARRYGKVENAEKAEEKDMLQGEFKELDAEGNVVEGGIESTSTIALEFIEDEKAKKPLVGATVDQTFTIEPEKVSKGHEDMGKMLDVDHHAVHELIDNKTKFQFTVKQIFRMIPAEVNQELFDKIYGEGTVASKEEFDAKIKEQLETMFSRDSDQLLMRDAQEALLEKLKLELPDTFLKKWLKATNEQPLTDEQIEAEYDDYTKQLRWQLITNKIIKENEVKIEQEELLEYTKGLVRNQFAQYGQAEIGDEIVEESAKRALQSEEDLRNIYDQLLGQKMLALFKETFKLKNKEVSFDDFVKLATGKPAKKGLLNNLTNIFG
tara:strand:+ start:4884 stop:6293 length:1410 start_codon:yes stop_codon:yes gene_type:complete